MKRPTAGFKKREVLEKACKIGKFNKTHNFYYFYQNKYYRLYSNNE